MSKTTVTRKAISAKLIAHATKAFEELSGSKPSEKGVKQISKSTRKLVKSIHSLIKKLQKKRAKEAKALARKKAKAAKQALKKKSKSIVVAKTAKRVKKVPVK